MENTTNTTVQVETAEQTAQRRKEETLLANRLIGLYMSRQRSISTDGKIVESNTFTPEEREAQAQSITALLINDITDEKAEIIERVLNYEMHVQRHDFQIIDGENKPVIYESIVSAFDGECRPQLTSALSSFIIAKATQKIQR